MMNQLQEKNCVRVKFEILASFIVNPSNSISQTIVLLVIIHLKF